MSNKTAAAEFERWFTEEECLPDRFDAWLAGQAALRGKLVRMITETAMCDECKRRAIERIGVSSD